MITNELREYKENTKVHQFYKEQHLIQTYSYVKQKL